MCRSMVVIMVVDESFTPRGTAAPPSTPRQIGITRRQRGRGGGGGGGAGGGSGSVVTRVWALALVNLSGDFAGPSGGSFAIFLPPANADPPLGGECWRDEGAIFRRVRGNPMPSLALPANYLGVDGSYVSKIESVRIINHPIKRRWNYDRRMI